MRAIEVLGMEKEKLIDHYLNISEIENNYETKHKPCDFLMKRPENCKDYPYTNRPERLYSLYSVLDVITVCPVAFEIYEKLKKEYGFQRKR